MCCVQCANCGCFKTPTVDAADSGNSLQVALGHHGFDTEPVTFVIFPFCSVWRIRTGPPGLAAATSAIFAASGCT